MIKDFLVPDLGEGLAEATVTDWLVAVGDAVALNQPLCTLETAKAEVEIPSPFAGTVVELRGEPGETLDVGGLLVRIDTTEPEPASSRRQPVLVGYGVDEDADRSRRPAAANSVRPPAAKTLAKPPVRRLARDLGVDLTALAPGSGTGGIITRADVTLAARKSNTNDPERAGATVRVTGVRLRMAERMAASRGNIPDAHCAVTVDCARLLEVRARLRAAADADGAADAVTAFALILRMTVAALLRHPLLNSSWVDDGPAIRSHPAVHLGFAAATKRGLLVPVVRDAQRLSTLELAVEVSRLTAAARAGTLTPPELTGSTFTVSNFGALGLDEGVPVINYPEAAILGVGSVKPRPFVVGDVLTVRPTVTLTCAFDHRVADGAEAAAFLCELRDLIETPELALLR